MKLSEITLIINRCWNLTARKAEKLSKKRIFLIKESADEFENNIMSIITRIEKGEKCIALREDKPIAEITSLRQDVPIWTRKINITSLPKGVMAQSYVEAERNH